MTAAPKRTRLVEPGIAGSDELVERRADGSLVLRPEAERLFDVLRETEDAVSRDQELITHPERAAASEDGFASAGSE